MRYVLWGRDLQVDLRVICVEVKKYPCVPEDLTDRFKVEIEKRRG